MTAFVDVRGVDLSAVPDRVGFGALIEHVAVRRPERVRRSPAQRPDSSSDDIVIGDVAVGRLLGWRMSPEGTRQRVRRLALRPLYVAGGQRVYRRADVEALRGAA